MTAEQPPTAEHWLTYAEAAQRLGLTPEAVRALARRQHWPRRSPNAVGGQTWILVPADKLAANGHAESGRRTPASTDRQDHREQPLLTAGQNSDGQRTPPDTGEQIDRRADEILAAVREATETFAQITRD